MTNTPTRVLMLIDGLRMGGAERLFAALLPEIDRRRIDPVVCSVTERWDSEIADQLEFEGPRYTLDASSTFDLRALQRLVRLIQTEQIDVIHAQLTAATILGGMASLLTGKPLLLTRHTIEQVELSLKARLRWWLELAFSRHVARRVLAVSRATRRFLLRKGHRPDRVRVVYNGIDLDQFAERNLETIAARCTEFGLKARHKVIIMVGVLRPGKGHEVLFEAMQNVRQHCPDLRLLLVGSGIRERELKELCTRMGLDDIVIFAGERTDVPDLLGLADVFVLPSFFEALPTVLIEAMAANLPVVATNVGGIPEIVQPEVTGILVPPGQPQALANALIRLLSDDELARRMGQAGRKRAEERFSRPMQARHTEAHYLALAGLADENEGSVSLAVVEPVGRGGLIHYAYQWCQAVADEGADVTLITARDYELADYHHIFDVLSRLRLWNPRPEREFPVGGLRYRLDRLWRQVRRPLRGLRYVLSWFQIIALLTRLRPRVVQFGEITFPFEGLFLWYLKRRGFKLVDVAHNVRQFAEAHTAADIERKRSLRQRWYGWLYRQFDAIFVHAQYSRRLFMELYPTVPAERIHVIDHPAERLFLQARDPDFDMRRHLNIPDKAPVVLFFGTLMPYKGVEYLIQAFPQVLKKHPTAHLVIAGFPTKQIDLSILQQMIDAGGIRANTRLDLRYLPMEQVPCYMEASDVVAFPYRAIYQSGVLQVAYVFGKPVVATAVGGLPDVVEEGGTGLLVPPDDPVALAQAIIRLLDDPEAARRMGERARELAETRFSWQTLARSVNAVYKEITS